MTSGTSLSQVQALIARLRDLESECLRIAAADLPAERVAVRTAYEARLEQLEASHSRSWFGDHSATYYKNFDPPPAGRSFDVEWGFVPGFGGSHNVNWVTYSRDDIREFVFRDIGEAIFGEFHALADDLTSAFGIARDQTLDTIELLSVNISSRALERYRAKIENDLTPYSMTDYLMGEQKASLR